MAYKLTAKTPYGTWTDVSMHPKQFIVLADKTVADWTWEVTRDLRKIEACATLLGINQELKRRGLAKPLREAAEKQRAETITRLEGFDAHFADVITSEKKRLGVGKVGHGHTFFLDLAAALAHASKIIKEGATGVEILPVTSRRKVPDKQAVKRCLGITFTT